MKPAKFRVWDKHYKRWETRLCAVTANSNLIVYNTDTGEWFEPSHTGYEMSWSTGLTDKNGKEIYDGDIVEFNAGTKPRRAIIEFQVHCYNAGFYPNESANANCYWEIIGNIHQNPELLKNEKN